MKWGNYNEQAAERLNKVLGRVVSSRAFFVLLALASLIAIAAADNKFRG